MKKILILLCMTASILSFTNLQCAYSQATLGKLSRPKWDKAEHYFNIAEDYDEQGKTKERDENYDKAVEGYLKLVKIVPEFPYSYYRISYIYRKTERYDQAIEIMKKCLKKIKASYAYLEIGSTYQMLANREKDAGKQIQLFTESLNYFTEGLKVNDDEAEKHGPNLLFNAFMCYYAIGDWDKTIEYGMKALECNSDEKIETILRGVSDAYMEKGDFKSAIEKVKQLLNNDPENVNFNRMLLTLYREAKMDKEYDEQFKVVEKLEPEDTSVLAVAGRKYFEEGNYEEAVKSFKKIIELEKRTQENMDLLVNAYINLGTVYLKMGKKQTALDCFKVVDALSKGNYDVVITLAYEYFKMGNYSKAIKYYKEAVPLTSKKSTIYQDIGSCYYNLKDFANAETYYLKAIGLNSKLLTSRRGLVDIYINQKRHKDAYNQILEILKQDPNDSQMKKYKQDIEEQDLLNK